MSSLRGRRRYGGQAGVAQSQGDLSAFLPFWAKLLLRSLAGLSICLVLVPTAYLPVWSVFGTDVIGRLEGIDQASYSWFQHLLATSAWRESLAYSITVAISSSLAGAVIVTITLYYLHFRSLWLETLTFIAASMVLLTPAIVYAVALRWCGSLLGVPEATVLTAGHVAVILPLQYLIFESARETIPSSMIHAGRTLGASHWRNFWAVFFPNAIRPFGAALIVGFFVSFDEVVVAVFVLERSLVTVPLRLWQQLSHQATPDPAVIASLMICAFLSVLGVGVLLSRLASRPARRRVSSP